MHGIKRRFWVNCALVLALSAPAVVAAETVDVKSWLGRTGVRLVAVEFYATWCKPCMEAIPRWKALHEKYRDQGLRLIVVNTQDPEAGCRSLAWQPDKVVCDYDGAIDARFGVGGKLPSAFLWSWQGKLLVKAGHVPEVGAKIAQYLRTSPRVAVEARGIKGKTDAALQALVQSRLTMRDKLTVVLSEKEREALRVLRRQSRAAGRDDSQQCELGVEVSANSLLLARLKRTGGNTRLFLSLQSVERGCLSASASVLWRPTRHQAVVGEAVDALLARLTGALQRPVSTVPVAAPRETKLGAGAGDWRAGGAATGAVVAFKSTPAGALVMVDGKPVCQKTPCSKTLSQGPHRVEMALQQYLPRKETINLKGEAAVEWTLEPNFGWLAVTSDPPGLEVHIDNQVAGRTPLAARRLDAGAHDVLVVAPCRYDAGERVVLPRGKRRTLTLTSKFKPAGLRVTARDDRGNDLAADILVDGARVGRAPGIFTIPMCSKHIEVRHAELGSFKAKLTLQEKVTSDVNARFRNPSGGVAVPVRASDTAQPVVISGGGGGRALLWTGVTAAVVGAGLAITGHVLRADILDGKSEDGALSQRDAMPMEERANGLLIGGYSVLGAGVISALVSLALPSGAPALSIGPVPHPNQAAGGWFVALDGGF